MPQLWQLARIVAIYKTEGATTLPHNYRPIARLQAMYKVFTSLIERRHRVLEPRLWKIQMGYRSGRSTADANHLLLRAIELTLRWQGIPLYLLCLDWKKCYDRIHIKRLLQALRRFGLPDHYLQIIEVISATCNLLLVTNGVNQRTSGRTKVFGKATLSRVFFWLSS